MALLAGCSGKPKMGTVLRMTDSKVMVRLMDNMSVVDLYSKAPYTKGDIVCVRHTGFPDNFWYFSECPDGFVGWTDAREYPITTSPGERQPDTHEPTTKIPVDWSKIRVRRIN